jgi:hypothetical protein
VTGALLADAAGLEAPAELDGVADEPDVVDEPDDEQAAAAARQISAAATRPEAAADPPVKAVSPRRMRGFRVVAEGSTRGNTPVPLLSVRRGLRRSASMTASQARRLAPR